MLLEALKRNNDEPEPDAGIATLYAFAAPKLRRQIGTLETFRRVMHNPRYAPLSGHGESDLGELMRLGASARQALTVVSSGRPVPYLFALVRSDTGEHAGCWLLSGVSREDALE